MALFDGFVRRAIESLSIAGLRYIMTATAGRHLCELHHRSTITTLAGVSIGFECGLFGGTDISAGRSDAHLAASINALHVMEEIGAHIGRQ